MSIQRISGGTGQQSTNTPATTATTTTAAQAQILSSNPAQPIVTISNPRRTAVVPTATNSRSRTTGPTRTPRGQRGQREEPTEAQHLALLRSRNVLVLPAPRRSFIKQFLLHLERNNLTWEGVSDNGSLESEVESAIHQGGLARATRSAINTAFGLNLQAGPRLNQATQSLPEHQALMLSLRQNNTATTDVSFINRFLTWMEGQQLSWSIVSANTAVLQTIVNGAINQGLQTGTRAALNRVFNLTLQGTTGYVRLAPFLPEHNVLMTQARQSTALQDNDISRVNRFLCFLEQNNLSWSAISTNTLQLEAIVSAAISQDGLETSTRAALNRAFGMNLRAPRYGGA